MDKKIRDVTFTWEEGRYFDLWMAVHTLSGVFLGFFFSLLLFKTPTAYTVALVLLIFWEIFEKYILRIYETKDNRVIDIVVGMIGFAACFHWSQKLSFDSVFPLLIFSGVILLSFTLLGWLDFRRRRLAKLKKIQ